MNKGRRIKLDISVVIKLINKRAPIDDVPLWGDKYKVLNEKIVVNPLNKIAKGVFDLKISFNCF